MGISLYGDDLDLLRVNAEDISKMLSRVPGSADVSVEQTAEINLTSFEFPSRFWRTERGIPTLTGDGVPTGACARLRVARTLRED